MRSKTFLVLTLTVWIMMCVRASILPISTGHFIPKCPLLRGRAQFSSRCDCLTGPIPAVARSNCARFWCVIHLQKKIKVVIKSLYAAFESAHWQKLNVRDVPALLNNKIVETNKFLGIISVYMLQTVSCFCRRILATTQSLSWPHKLLPLCGTAATSA